METTKSKVISPCGICGGDIPRTVSMFSTTVCPTASKFKFGDVPLYRKNKYGG